MANEDSHQQLKLQIKITVCFIPTFIFIIVILFLFCLGYHYKGPPCPFEEFLNTLLRFASIFTEEKWKDPRKVFIFRNMPSQHFNVADGFFKEVMSSTEKECSKKPNLLEHWTGIYMKEVSQVYGFHFMNSAALYADRWDLHFPENRDCIHSCLTPEVAIAEMALMNQILGL